MYCVETTFGKLKIGDVFKFGFDRGEWRYVKATQDTVECVIAPPTYNVAKGRIDSWKDNREKVFVFYDNEDEAYA